MNIDYVKVKLVKEKNVTYDSMIKINSPSSIVNTLNDLFELEGETQEHMLLVCLDTKCKIMSVQELSKGTIDSTVVDPKLVYTTALLQGACSIILAHNHPSGDSIPSNSDIDVTKRIKKSGELLGITLLDHIIIGDGNYTSIKELGEL